MAPGSAILLCCIFAAFFLATHAARSQQQSCRSSSVVHKKTFRSPAFSLAPGEVQDRYYWMDFPKGEVGIRSFFGEVVDENGASVPLSEVYLHHWVVLPVFRPRNYSSNLRSGAHNLLSDPTISRAAVNDPAITQAGNDGICQQGVLSQFWGLGSETRHTDDSLPAPYAIKIGDPNKPPAGHEEAWVLNVHAIDTRGTVDAQGCLECRCSLYNVDKKANGEPLAPGYIGGLACCYEGTRCKLRDGHSGDKRKLFLQYTVEWVDWDECVVPVRTYILDVTDDGCRDEQDRSVGCKIEYDVPKCSMDTGLSGECTHVKQATVSIPKGGHLVYGAAHQHYGAKNMVLQGEDGREICKSSARYGTGSEAGNEAGYVVGMGTCYPQPGSVSIGSNEKLTITSYYSSHEFHTGVMALFYLHIADADASSSAPFIQGWQASPAVNSFAVGAAALLGCAVLLAVAAFLIARMRQASPGYEALQA